MSAGKTLTRLGVMLGIVVAMLPAVACADYTLNMSPGATNEGKAIYSLHMLVLWVVTFVGAAVFVVVIYSLINHRKSKGANPAHFHDSAIVEFIWTIIPFVMLVAIAIPATRTVLKMEDTSAPDLTIKVTAWQWKWEYEYVEDGMHFFSHLDAASNRARQLDSGTDPRSIQNYLLEVDHPMVVPLNKKVQLLITSHDVMHSWWVPELAVKREAVPGHVNEAWFRANRVGSFRGQCAELCGKDHAFMPIVVKVVEEVDYQDWLSRQRKQAMALKASEGRAWNMNELMQRGEQVYAASCAGCHQPDGMGLEGMYPPIAGSKIVTGPVEAHIAIVSEGRPNTAMQAFATQLNPNDMAAVITFQRNAFGNNTGDAVQASQITAQTSGGEKK